PRHQPDHQWRDDAEFQHEASDLRDPNADRVPLQRIYARAGRHHHHGHSGRCRFLQEAAALATPRRRCGGEDPGIGRVAQSSRGGGLALFSQRTPASMEPNRLSVMLNALRAAGAPLIDLTVSNPTRVNLPYPREEILAALHEKAVLTYEPT